MDLSLVGWGGVVVVCSIQTHFRVKPTRLLKCFKFFRLPQTVKIIKSKWSYHYLMIVSNFLIMLDVLAELTSESEINHITFFMQGYRIMKVCLIL